MDIVDFEYPSSTARSAVPLPRNGLPVTGKVFFELQVDVNNLQQVCRTLLGAAHEVKPFFTEYPIRLVARVVGKFQPNSAKFGRVPKLCVLPGDAGGMGDPGERFIRPCRFPAPLPSPTAAAR